MLTYTPIGSTANIHTPCPTLRIAKTTKFRSANSMDQQIKGRKLRPFAFWRAKQEVTDTPC